MILASMRPRVPLQVFGVPGRKFAALGHTGEDATVLFGHRRRSLRLLDHDHL